MTIKEIANSLGVSTATVSNVIHGHLEKMSPETAQLIRKKLEQYQYIPNMSARMLAKGDSEIVGVITNYPNREEKFALADPFVSEMIAALENSIRGRGYYTMLRAAQTAAEIHRMFFEGPWAPFSDEKGIVPALIPTWNGKSASVVGGENIVIFSGSEKQEAAFRFVQFMLSEEVQLELLKVGVIPTLKACVNSEAVQADPKWSVYMKQLESAQSRIPTPQASTVEQLWQDAMTEIFIEGADVQSTLSSYAAEIDAELAK